MAARVTGGCASVIARKIRNPDAPRAQSPTDGPRQAAPLSGQSPRGSGTRTCTGGPPAAVPPVAHWTLPESRTVYLQYHGTSEGRGGLCLIRSVWASYGVPRLPRAAVHARFTINCPDSAGLAAPILRASVRCQPPARGCLAQPCMSGPQNPLTMPAMLPDPESVPPGDVSRDPQRSGRGAASGRSRGGGRRSPASAPNRPGWRSRPDRHPRCPPPWHRWCRGRQAPVWRA